MGDNGHGLSGKNLIEIKERGENKGLEEKEFKSRTENNKKVETKNKQRGNQKKR